MTVKENQTCLRQDIETLFLSQPRPCDYQESDLHGNRLETRQIWVSPALNEYLSWPGVKQVMQLKRTREIKGRFSLEVVYGITSSSAAPCDLLRYWRGHWEIENRLFWVRDVTLGEDLSQIRLGAAPQVMAALRNLALNILRINGLNNIAATVRSLAWNSHKALRLLFDA